MASFGYDPDIFAEPSEKLQEFKCPVCLYITREPHLTGCCGQNFCQNCIGRINGPCPLCKRPVFQTLHDKKQKRKIMELKARCSNRGCGWMNEFGGLENHLNTECLFTVVPCTNGCGQTPQRGSLLQHIQEACPFRLCRCVYCGFTMQYHGMSMHLAVCDKRPVTCPNRCQLSVEQGGLEHHLTQCPLQCVTCEFSQFGCVEQLCRKDLDAHREQNVSRHLSLVMASSQRNHERLLQQERQVEELQGKLLMKNVQVKELWEKLAARDSQVELLRRRVDALEMCTQTCSLPPFVFTMSNFSHCKNSGLSWDGPNFYTHPKGARLKLRVFFSQTHEEMAVKIYRLPGEYDSRLSFTCTIKLQILGSQHNLEESIRVVLPQYQKVTEVGILRWPYRTLLPSPMRPGAQYVKDDCILFRVEVIQMRR